jgi:hypothetical protein
MTDEGVAFDRADDGETSSHVSARQLNDSLTTTQLSGAFRVLNDSQCCPVLLREPRVQIIKLKENPAMKWTGDARQLNEWCIVDGLKDRWYCRHVPLRVRLEFPGFTGDLSVVA